MDIQAERQNTKEAREAAKAAEEKVKTAEEKVKAAEEKTQNMEALVNLVLKDLILQRKASGCTKEEVQHELQTRYSLEASDSEQKTDQYWE